jgi:hypothetical protein
MVTFLVIGCTDVGVILTSSTQQVWSGFSEGFLEQQKAEFGIFVETILVDIFK